MRKNIFSEIQKYLNKYRKRSLWQKIVIALACVVVFCTTYALILPAITLENDSITEVIQNASDSSEGEGSDIVLGTGTVDFTKYITSITLERKPQYGNSWEDVQNGGVVKEKDQLRFNINYTLPGGTLSIDSPSIVYKLPNNIKPLNSSSGKVMDNGVAIGEYVISQDGTIKIDFYKEYVQKNAAGHDISGFIRFESSVDDIIWDNNEKVDIKFNDKQTVTIELEKEAIETEDLQVTKKASEVKENGVVTYTIEVSSKNGTASEVVLKDTMTNTVFNGNFKVVDGNGNTLDITSPDNGCKEFQITLPQMKAGGKYIITYDAKFNEVVNGTVQSNNKVTVNSTNTNGDKIKDEASVDVTFTNELIKKTGKLNENKDKIEWTITINKSKQDISGWILSDKLSGVDFKGKVTISPSPEGGERPLETNLPYTFPENSKETYTVTYTTDVDKDVGGYVTSNTATIKPSEGDDGYSDKSEVGDGSQFIPLKKRATDIKDNGNKTADITWNVSIDAKEGDIPEGWVFTEQLQGNQWFTDEQKQEIETIFKNLNSTYPNSIVWTTSYVTVGGVHQLKTTGFKVTFSTALEKGKKIEFTYKSTGDLGDGTLDITFKNGANINDKVWVSDQIKYTPPAPVVAKYDLNNTSGANTNYNYNDIKDGILKWGFKVNIPKLAQGKDIVITEDLPEGVSLLENEGLKLIYGGQTYIFDFKDGENAQIKLGEYTITATKGSRNTININIPQGLTSTSDLKEFVFEVKVKIDENFDRWESENYTYKAIFKNSIIVKVDNQEWKDTQTQTITKDYIEDENVLGKQVGNFENNIIPYSIVVNKEGADLLEGSDILTLKDELKYGEWLWLQHQVDIKFVYESFHVYKYDNGIKGEEIDVKYTFNKETIPGTIFNKLSIEVPDEQPLLVEYKYEISGNYQWNIDVLNDVVLEGEHFDSNISKGQITVQIVDSSAGATLNGINIYKVDSSNYSNLLHGAEFELYRWDGSAYVKEKTFTIDESGKFAIEDIVYNTAYKLVETKAPEGYILKTEPFYFYVVKTGEPITKPNDFNGVEYKAGNDIYFENKMDGTEITVNKKWFDSNGDVVIGEDNLGEVKFKLWRKEKDDTTGATKELYRQESYTLSSENKWKITIGSLPKTGVNSSGETVEYLYYVEEDGDVLNYETSYENNDGVITGTITIKNTQIKNPEYELPETGMFGGKGLFILGGLLMLAGSLYIYRQKHKGDMSK